MIIEVDVCILSTSSRQKCQLSTCDFVFAGLASLFIETTTSNNKQKIIKLNSTSGFVVVNVYNCVPCKVAYCVSRCTSRLRREDQSWRRKTSVLSRALTLSTNTLINPLTAHSLHSTIYFCDINVPREWMVEGKHLT